MFLFLRFLRAHVVAGDTAGKTNNFSGARVLGLVAADIF